MRANCTKQRLFCGYSAIRIQSTHNDCVAIRSKPAFLSPWSREWMNEYYCNLKMSSNPGMSIKTFNDIYDPSFIIHANRKDRPASEFNSFPLNINPTIGRTNPRFFGFTSTHHCRSIASHSRQASSSSVALSSFALTTGMFSPPLLPPSRTCWL